MKLSIIVPIYKVEQYLRKCLDSIINQSFTDYEVIMVDDGSPDNSGAICDEYAALDSRFKVIHQQNAGVSAARNAALDIAQGEFITFCDSDDFFEPDAFNAFDFTHDISIYLLNHYYAETDQKTPIYVNAPVQSKWDYITNHRGYLHTKLFRRSVIGDTRLNTNIKTSEDNVYSINIFKKTDDIIVVPIIIYNYLIRKVSLSHGACDLIWYEQHFVVIKYALEGGTVNDPEFIKNVKNLYMCRVLKHLCFVANCKPTKQQKKDILLRINKYKDIARKDKISKIIYAIIKIFGLSFALWLLKPIGKAFIKEEGRNIVILPDFKFSDLSI